MKNLFKLNRDNKIKKDTKKYRLKNLIVEYINKHNQRKNQQ